MIKPLTIGNTTFTSNLIQGPLAGYTCAPMRKLTWTNSQPAYCTTEMVSANHLVHAKAPPMRYFSRDKTEGPLCFQLSGNNPEHLALATRKINNLNCEIIDINCGCPVNKIRNKGAGSKLLANPEHIAKLINAVKQHTDAAVTIKIRVSGEYTDQDDLLVAQSAEKAGADAIIVHGRHWTERYETPCRYEQIKRIVKAVDIPVIGNGDVEDATSLQKMFAETHCAGVMIARASLGQPWLFAKIQSELNGNTYTLPTPDEIGCMFLQHIGDLAAQDGELRALLQARKLVKYYYRQPLVSPSMQALVQCQNLTELHKLINDLQ